MNFEIGLYVFDIIQNGSNFCLGVGMYNSAQREDFTKTEFSRLYEHRQTRLTESYNRGSRKSIVCVANQSRDQTFLYSQLQSRIHSQTR